MPRARKKADTSAEAAPAEDTSFDPAAFDATQPTATITAAEILHGVSESMKLPDDVQHTPTPTTAPEPTRQPVDQPTRHAEAVERKSLSRPADPFGIATDMLAGVRLSESRRFGKMLIAFEEKPSPEVTAKLRDADFRWEPADRVWALGLGDRPMSARITADDTFKEVSKMIRQERGIQHSVGLDAG